MKTSASLLVLGLAIELSACGWTKPKDGPEDATIERDRALAQRLQSACSSQAAYDRLKQVAFDEAIQIRNADPANLDILSTHALVRVENPVVESHDKTLDITVCSGRFILQVPPGAEKAFEGRRQLMADIEYAAQAAADGSGQVYQMRGAEPIIYRLATFDLRSRSYRPNTDKATVAVAEPPAPPSNPKAVSPPATRPEQTPAPKPTRAPAVVASAEHPAASQRMETSAPSFECHTGQSRSERMVCSSNRLASLDRPMSSLFFSELNRGSERERSDLRRTRDRFLADRERCSDENCVAQAYIDRMNEIKEITGSR